MERIRAQIAARLRRDARDPETIASRLWFKTAFPGHPYGRPSKGDAETLALIDRADLVDFHRKVFSRQSLKISVVGDIDAATLGGILDQVFGALPDTSDLSSVSKIMPKDGITNNHELAVPQTVIRFGGRGLARNDPDFMAAYVMNHILGGGSFSSRLYREVREKRGLAYSVYTYLAPFDHGPVFIGGLATRADQADMAIDLVRQEIKRMAETGPSEQELASAKEYLTGSYPLRFDTSSKIANQLVGIQMENLGIDYITTRNGQIEAVTIDHVRRTAKRLLGAGGLIISTVGKSGS
jgi:zinc protease